MQDNYQWHVLENSDDVAQAVCQRILNAADQAIVERGVFKLVLAGGSTPEKIYRLLSKAQADWDKWFIYHGDERCLPVGHADRNSTMVQQALLAHVAIPENHIYNIPTELPPEVAASAYHQLVASALPFDLVLLGMGEDGHTASLFPGHSASSDDWAYAVYNSPKPPPERVTLSAKALSATQQLIFIITGTSKQEAIQQWRAGHMLPVTTVSAKSAVEIYLDKAARPDDF